ncbi:MAG: hypothetical protein ABSH39_10835, partial [Candidatus Acidiferrum sp.]
VVVSESSKQFCLLLPPLRWAPFSVAGRTIFEFDERSGDSPMALHRWFYPGDNFGQRFVCPDYEYPQPTS